MRICHIITRLIRGGADENTIISCNSQAALGHDVWLVHGREWHEEMAARLDKRVTRICLPSMVWPISPANDLIALARCAYLLRRIKPHIVHTHTSKAGIIGRIAALIARCPLIIHGVHIIPWLGTEGIRKAMYLFLERAAGKITNAFIDVAEDLRELYLDEGIGDQAQHHVVPSGMDLERFRRARNNPIDWRSLIPAEAIDTRSPKFLVHVSALEPRKRQSEFLEVFQRIAWAEPDAVLIIVGHGAERRAIETRIRSLGLSRRAICVGFQSRVEDWISLAQVCLLTSAREGLARVLVQYALQEKAIVSTNLAGCRLIVRHGLNGFLVNPDRLDLMAEPILKLLKAPHLARSMGQASATLDLSPWSSSEMAKRIEEIYHTLAQKVGADQ